VLELDSELVFVGDEGATEPRGPSRRGGWEIATRVDITDWLMFSGDVTLTRAEFDDGDAVPLAPRMTARADLTARLPFGLATSVAMRHLGDRYLIEDCSVEGPGHTLFDFVARYRYKFAEAFFTIREPLRRGLARSAVLLHLEPGGRAGRRRGRRPLHAGQPAHVPRGAGVQALSRAMSASIDRGVVTGVVVSLLGHAAAIAGLSFVHPAGGPATIPASLVVLSAPGPSAPAAPAAPAGAPRAAAPPAAVARAAPPDAVPPAAVQPSIPAPEPVPPPAEPAVEAPAPSATAWPRVNEPAPTASRLAFAPVRGAGAEPSPTPEPARPVWPVAPGPPVAVSPFAALRAGPAGSSDDTPAPSPANPGGEPGGDGHARAPSGTGADRGGLLSPPRLRADATPRYPEAARRSGIEGTVLVRAQVLADGTVGTAEVRRSAGHDALDRAALDTIRRASFVPAERGGRPVTVWVEVPVQFRLDH
jgi:protein TonB